MRIGLIVDLMDTAAGRRVRADGRRRAFRPGLERFEARSLLSVAAEYSAGRYIISASTGSEAVVVPLAGYLALFTSEGPQGQISLTNVIPEAVVTQITFQGAGQNILADLASNVRAQFLAGFGASEMVSVAPGSTFYGGPGGSLIDALGGYD